MLTEQSSFMTAALLTRKWQRACKEWRPAEVAFQELTAGSDPAKCAEWKRDADAADATRNVNPAAMDIYDVSATPCTPQCNCLMSPC